MDQPRKVRVEWVGADDVPQVLRDCAEAEAQALRDRCEKMRFMSIECRRWRGEQDSRVSCRCADGSRCIRVRRPTIGEALLAFARAMRSRCLGLRGTADTGAGEGS